MAEWLLTIWFTILPTDSLEPKEFSFTTSHQTLEQCLVEEEKFGSLSVVLPGVEFHAEAGCSPNPHYCTDDGCSEFALSKKSIRDNNE